jgi:hypothetical protein
MQVGSNSSFISADVSHLKFSVPKKEINLRTSFSLDISHESIDKEYGNVNEKINNYLRFKIKIQETENLGTRILTGIKKSPGIQESHKKSVEIFKKMVQLLKKDCPFDIRGLELQVSELESLVAAAAPSKKRALENPENNVPTKKPKVQAVVPENSPRVHYQCDLEHILERHGFNSGSSGTSHFNSFQEQDLLGLIRTTILKAPVAVKSTRFTNTHTHQFTFNFPIGLSTSGAPTRTIRVVTNDVDKIIKTAIPV